MQSILSKAISKENIFDYIIKKIEDEVNTPCNSMLDIKNKNKNQIRGKLWEEFCYLYLLSEGYIVYYTYNLPNTISEKINLSNTRDIGIDLIAIMNDKYYAIQCKYRNSKSSYNKGKVNWKELSTFYAACNLTGPYSKKIIMTNCFGITYSKGVPKDINVKVIAKGSFTKMSSLDYAKLIPYRIIESISENNKLKNEINLEEIRKLRLIKYCK